MTVAKRRKALTVASGIYWETVAYAVACALPVVTAFAIKQYTLRVPYMDEWEWADLVFRMHIGTLHFGDLWQQHNEHRMLVPNLIALALASLGGWNQFRETLFSLLLVVISQIGVFVLLRRVVLPQKLPFAFLAASLMLYSLAQMENWDWGFQIAWFMCNACAVWTVLLLGASGQSWFALVAGAVLTALASFSSSQGLMVWLAGMSTLFLTEKRRPAQIVTWIGLTVLAFLIYFRGYEHPQAHPDMLLGLHHPFAAAGYIGAYFGQVLAGWISFSAATAVGWAGLLVLGGLLCLGVNLYRSDRREVSRMASFVGLATYVVCVAIITDAGRLGFGVAQAQASRYTSIALYGWITIFALGVALERHYMSRIPRHVVALWPALLAVLVLLYAGADRAGIALGQGRLAQVRSAYPALLLGHGPELAILYPVAKSVEIWLNELRAIKDGPYYP